MNTFSAIILAALLVLLGGAVYFFYQGDSSVELPFTWNSEPIPLLPINNQPNLPQGPLVNTEVKQFYPNMRFPDSSISYNFEEACSEAKKQQVSESFAIIEERTVLRFHPSIDKGGINILCSELAPEPEFKGHFVAGEGGPTEIINTTLFSVIQGGKISLFRDEKCSTPHIALHEILHVLGFDHVSNQLSILYPTLDCDQVMDEAVVEEISRLYNLPSNSDLIISDISATKTGKYLDFEIEVLNQGLVEAHQVTFSIYADENFVREFSLDNIDIGTRKILTVEYMPIPSSTSKVRFEIDEKNNIAEIYEDNNRAELALASP